MAEINFNDLDVRESWCTGHNSLLSVKSFYKSHSPRYINGVQPMCKDCANKLCKEYLDKTNDIETAIYYTCAFLDVPFVKKVFDNTNEQFKNKAKNNAETHLWSIYMQYYNKLSKKDSAQYIAFMDSDKVGIGVLNGMTEEQKINLEAIEELHKYWGKELNVEDLEFLEARMYDYTKDIADLSVYQESLYKDLCLTELQIYLKDNVSDAFKQKQKIAEKLGIDVFESNKKASYAEETIENQIFIMEEEEPAEYMENQELYKDFMGLGRKWILDILRPIKNLVTGSKDYTITNDDVSAFDEKVKDLEDEG